MRLIGRRHRSRQRTPTHSAAQQQIPRTIQAELEQTPEWWDHQYQHLIRKHIPRDEASHATHNLIESSTYAGITYRACSDCGVTLDPSTHDATPDQPDNLRTTNRAANP